MKRLLLLSFAFCLFLSAYAQEQIKTYRIKQGRYNADITIQCQGSFKHGILSDGPVVFSYRGRNYSEIILDGIYRSDSTDTFYGTLTFSEVWSNGRAKLPCYGTIYNNKENRTISKKSSANNWEINLQFYAFIGNDSQTVAIINQPFHETTKFSAEGKLINLAWDQLSKLAGRIPDATVYFPDGCKYIGPIYWTNRPDHTAAWWIGKSWEDKTPVDYQYVWPNGDSFKGKIHTNHCHGDNPNPLNGVYIHSGRFQLVDGSTLEYTDYCNNQQYHYSHSYLYYVNKSDEYLKQYPCPSQLFPILKERQQKDDAEKRQQELKKQQEEARKKALEREAQLKKEREQQAQAEQRRKQLIRKYGQKWGELLAQGKIELGMTKQMCQEVVNVKFYDISKSSYFGRIVETWMFDQDKLAMSSAGGFLGMALLKGFADTFGIPTPAIVPYTYLVFTDGELTSVH